MGDARSGIDPSALRRYGAGVALPFVLLVGAGWAWTRAPDAARPTSGTTGQAQRSTSDARAPSPRDGGTPAPIGPTTGAPTASGPRPTMLSGPGISDPGVHLSVAPLPDGSLQVTERVFLPHVLSQVPVRPPDLRPAGRSFGTAHPVATAVQLAVDGQPLPVDGGTVSRRLVVVVGRPASVLELRYVLTGATVRSLPSTSGRALAAIAPLVPVGAAPVVVTTTGKAVRNLSCPQLSGDAQACADGVRDAMAVRSPLRGDRSVVVLQLDLATP